jgi:hypothetical protein
LSPEGATKLTPAPARHEPVHWKHRWKKRGVTWARWTHIYLSMVSFAILLFFAVTGFTLNHQDWFDQQQRTTVYKGTLNHNWLAKDVAQLKIVEQLRQAHGIKAALGELRIDEGQISVNFKGPGYSADASIDRSTGAYELTETRAGWAAVMNDLHKGRDAGQLWAKLIDAAALLMTVVAASGLTLIFFLAKWRKSGLIMLAAGALVCYLVFVRFVP